MTSARIENKNSKHFQNTNFLEEFDKKLSAAVKKNFTLKQLRCLIEQEIRE